MKMMGYHPVQSLSTYLSNSKHSQQLSYSASMTLDGLGSEQTTEGLSINPGPLVKVGSIPKVYRLKFEVSQSESKVKMSIGKSGR